MIGKPEHFDVSLYLKAVEEMIKADELTRALWMLDNLPGYYRDFQPPEVSEMRQTLLRQIMTVDDYLQDVDETRKGSEEYFCGWAIEDQFQLSHYQPRAEIAFKLIDELNAKGQTPHIIELAPANFWLPYGLQKYGRKFTYCGHSLQKNVLAQAKNDLAQVWRNVKPSGQPIIFICFETIEHLWHEDEIYHYYAKVCGRADYILISTPKYTLGGGLPDWRTRTLGHLRTYTPSELMQYAFKHWPRYEWEFFDAAMMVLQGKVKA